MNSITYPFFEDARRSCTYILSFDINCPPRDARDDCIQIADLLLNRVVRNCEQIDCEVRSVVCPFQLWFFYRHRRRLLNTKHPKPQEEEIYTSQRMLQLLSLLPLQQPILLLTVSLSAHLPPVFTTRKLPARQDLFD